MTKNNNHALVIGASGLIGWSVVNQLLQCYPAEGTFSRVTALVNRPLELEKSFWPKATESTPELELIAGIDLLCADEQLEATLKEKIASVGSITHVYYFGTSKPGHQVLLTSADKKKSIQRQLRPHPRSRPQRRHDAPPRPRHHPPIPRPKILRLPRRHARKLPFQATPPPSLSSPSNPTDLEQGYGIYRPNGIFSAPLLEEMAHNLPADYKETVAYPHYRAMLSLESANANWSWCELVPDAIIGFTPNGSGFSLAGHWATYLSTYRLVYGEGAEVRFPGVLKGYESFFTSVSASSLARVAVFASMHPEEFGERIFNVADSEKPASMRQIWPQITACFGLKGVPPSATASPEDEKPSQFVKRHAEVLRKAGVKEVGIWNKKQLDSYGYWLTFDRQLGLGRLRGTGWGEEREMIEGWREAFDMFRKAGMVV